MDYNYVFFTTLVLDGMMERTILENLGISVEVLS